MQHIFAETYKGVFYSKSLAYLGTLFKGSFAASFSFIFVFLIQLTVNVQYKFLPMTVFEPQTSGIGSDRSTN